VDIVEDVVEDEDDDEEDDEDDMSQFEFIMDLDMISTGFPPWGLSMAGLELATFGSDNDRLIKPNINRLLDYRNILLWNVNLLL